MQRKKSYKSKDDFDPNLKHWFLRLGYETLSMLVLETKRATHHFYRPSPPVVAILYALHAQEPVTHHRRR
jgi:hypothetical protein